MPPKPNDKEPDSTKSDKPEMDFNGFTEASFEKLKASLKLRGGQWSCRINKTTFIFPQETTKGQAEKVLEAGFLLYRTRLN